MQVNRASVQGLEKASLNFHSFPRLSEHCEPWNKQTNKQSHIRLQDHWACWLCRWIKTSVQGLEKASLNFHSFPSLSKTLCEHWKKQMSKQRKRILMVHCVFSRPTIWRRSRTGWRRCVSWSRRESSTCTRRSRTSSPPCLNLHPRCSTPAESAGIYDKNNMRLGTQS